MFSVKVFIYLFQFGLGSDRSSNFENFNHLVYIIFIIAYIYTHLRDEYDDNPCCWPSKADGFTWSYSDIREYFVGRKYIIDLATSYRTPEYSTGCDGVSRVGSRGKW